MDLMKYEEVAKELRVSVATCKRLVYEGTIPAYRISDRVVRIRRDDLTAALAATRTGTGA